MGDNDLAIGDVVVINKCNAHPQFVGKQAKVVAFAPAEVEAKYPVRVEVLDSEDTEAVLAQAQKIAGLCTGRFAPLAQIAMQVANLKAICDFRVSELTPLGTEVPKEISDAFET